MVDFYNVLIEGWEIFDSNGGMSGFAVVYQAANAEKFDQRERLYN